MFDEIWLNILKKSKIFKLGSYKWPLKRIIIAAGLTVLFFHTLNCLVSISEGKISSSYERVGKLEASRFSCRDIIPIRTKLFYQIRHVIPTVSYQWDQNWHKLHFTGTQHSIHLSMTQTSWKYISAYCKHCSTEASLFTQVNPKKSKTSGYNST